MTYYITWLDSGIVKVLQTTGIQFMLRFMDNLKMKTMQ